MSTIIRFGTLGSIDEVGVDSHSSARSRLFGSTHRYISCGFTNRPAWDLGTYEPTKRGCAGSARSKNLMSNGKVVSFPGAQSWITELQRNVITSSSFFCGQ